MQIAFGVFAGVFLQVRRKSRGTRIGLTQKAAKFGIFKKHPIKNTPYRRNTQAKTPPYQADFKRKCVSPNELGGLRGFLSEL